METTTVYWGYIGIMEKKMETTGAYGGYIGITYWVGEEDRAMACGYGCLITPWKVVARVQAQTQCFALSRSQTQTFSKSGAPAELQVTTFAGIQTVTASATLSM